jgi:hypothetical protein
VDIGISLWVVMLAVSTFGVVGSHGRLLPHHRAVSALTPAVRMAEGGEVL